MTAPDAPFPGTPGRCHMPSGLFDTIAAGGGGVEGVGLLRDAEYSRRLLLLRAVADRAGRHGGAAGRTAHEAWRTLAAAQQRSPGVFRELLLYPSVGPALLGLLDDRPRRDEAVTRPALSALAAAAVIRTGLPVPVVLPVCGEAVVLPSLGRAAFPGMPDGEPAVVRSGTSGADVVADGRRIRVLPPAPAPPTPDRTGPGARGEGWQGLRELVRFDTGTLLCLDDVDPNSMPISGRCGRLPDIEWQPWRQVVADGWDLLRTSHPDVAAEAAVVFRALVPIAGPEGNRRSGSSEETFGSAAMTLPVSPVALALAVGHELQHNKLVALLHLFRLTAEQPGEAFYAPWRQDPRPLVGLLHGMYAHLGVARFWHRRCTLESGAAARYAAQVQFARWRHAAREADETLLGCGRLTALGTRFALRAGRALGELAAEPLPSAAVAEGVALTVEHRREWLSQHGGVDEPAGRGT